MNRTSPKKTALGATVVVLLVLSGCTTKKDDAQDEDAKAPTSTSLPAECEEAAARQAEAAGADGTDEVATSTTLPPTCADALFNVAVDEGGSKELKALPASDRLGYAHGMCAFAQALLGEEAVAPTYKELVATTSESWGVDPPLVEEVIDLSATLCPGQMQPVLDLQTGASQITLRLQVTGNGRALVSYLAPDGTSLSDEVTVPWDHEVTLESATDFRLSARIPDGEATCSIMIDDKTVAEQNAGPGEESVCAATASELRDAAR